VDEGIKMKKLTLLLLIICSQALGQNVQLSGVQLNAGTRVAPKVVVPPVVDYWTYSGSSVTDYNTAGGLTPTIPGTNPDTSATITTLAADALNNKLLTSLTFPVPNTITTIGSRALRNNNINLLAIPAGVTSIDANGADCTNLGGAFGFRYLTLPTSLVSVGTSAFNGNSLLTSVNIAMSGITTIPDLMFGGCTSLQTITIHYGAEAGDPAGNNDGIITSIGQSAFLDSMITSVVIPNSCLYVGAGAFATQPGMTTVILPAGVTIADDTSFNDQMGTMGGLKTLYDGNGKLAGTYTYSSGWSKTY
jgi:hypothetical protein